jgi:hypothetical protein
VILRLLVAASWGFELFLGLASRGCYQLTFSRVGHKLVGFQAQGSGLKV